MRALDLLVAEHRLIEGVLEALDTRESMPARFYLEAVEFIRGFADQAHHRKEEGVLFKAMARYGFPEDQGPVGMMLAEHEEARQITRALEEAARRLESGDVAAGEHAVRHAQAYASLLRQHIEKEDQILYVMAEQAIPPDELDAMAEEFAAIDRDELGSGGRGRYEALAAALQRQAQSG
jgi:hemerythrin-like domain-containing protein